MEWRAKGRKERRCREAGSRTSAMTSGAVTNLSAEWVSLSPPSMRALASTTATAMPLADLQLSTKTLFAEFVSWLLGFGGGLLFTMLLQHGAAGVGVGAGFGFGVSSMVLLERSERETG